MFKFRVVSGVVLPDYITNVVTKYDQMILDIGEDGGGGGGGVRGISSCTLKVVPQDRVSSQDMKVEQSTKVAMVCACCLYTFHICATR